MHNRNVKIIQEIQGKERQWNLYAVVSEKKKKKKNRTAHKGNALLALALQGLSLLSLKSDQHSELYIYIYGCIYIEREKLCFRESRRVGK